MSRHFEGRRAGYRRGLRGPIAPQLAVMVLHFSSFPAVISSHSFPILVNGFIVSSSAFTSLKLIILFPLFLYSQISGILCSVTEIPVFSKILSCKYTLALISYYIIICHCIPGRYRTSGRGTGRPPHSTGWSGDWVRYSTCRRRRWASRAASPMVLVNSSGVIKWEQEQVAR